MAKMDNDPGDTTLHALARLRGGGGGLPRSGSRLPAPAPSTHNTGGVAVAITTGNRVSHSAHTKRHTAHMPYSVMNLGVDAKQAGQQLLSLLD